MSQAYHNLTKKIREEQTRKDDEVVATAAQILVDRIKENIIEHNEDDPEKYKTGGVFRGTINESDLTVSYKNSARKKRVLMKVADVALDTLEEEEFNVTESSSSYNIDVYNSSNYADLIVTISEVEAPPVVIPLSIVTAASTSQAFGHFTAGPGLFSSKLEFKKKPREETTPQSSCKAQRTS